ncbi:hypothetical protein [Agrobacterium sp. a22-2]|uniref:hypothetical protein n=1 Tax=Agrobacterium sp. a22-2 TaxID=2283840 RepID=UPI001FEEEEA1|nr:hypothetical protein [Agrobacterium sp. a22-2]
MQTSPPVPPRKSMTPWFALAAVVVAGVVVWSLMSGPSTDPATTSATPPAATETAPTVQPTTPAPATPPATGTAPATPNSGTTQP